MGILTVTVRQGMGVKEVTFEETFWFDIDTQEDQITHVLKSWSNITGLHWLNMPHTLTKDKEGYNILEVVSPMINRSTAIFYWRV